jgi:hypothetical protein
MLGRGVVCSSIWIQRLRFFGSRNRDRDRARPQPRPETVSVSKKLLIVTKRDQSCGRQPFRGNGEHRRQQQ